MLLKVGARNCYQMDGNIALTLIEALLILLALSISMANRFISPSLYDNQSTDAVDDSSKYDVILAQRDSPLATKYDIFLSFRGEDTRDTFSTYLYEALCDAKIQTFMDHKLHKGDHISPVLLKTIEESEISLIIFSKNFASSTWCMDELVHIMKCKDQYRRTVIPIFYNVDPSNVRKQDGSFGDGFIKLKQRFKHDQRRVQHWTNALNRSTNLSGWHSKNFRPEPELTKMIVKDILSKLSNNSSFHLEGLVGIGHQIQKIEELLSEARFVGIWGMGGIGKTTLAGVVFDRLKAQFEAFAFVGNVRERLEKIGFDELLEKCLKELLKDDDMKAYNLRSTFVERRLRHKKILLVLDDVHDSIAIEDLIKAFRWFGEGSRVIITSRDMQVLKNTYASTYHVQKLEFSHALHLFSLKAFKQNEPSKSYLELSERAVHYCNGNPLALKVLGCFLHGKGKKEWESALEKLNQAIHLGIFNVLKLSFDGLDDIQESVFLDLTFVLKEVWSISMDCTKCLYGSAHIDISVLKDRSLLSVDENGYIQMHALLIDMGLEISRQQLISNPRKPIRLRRPEDIYHLFNNDKGIEATRCLSLDESKMKSITLKASHFQKMHNLILFKAYKSDQRKPSALNVCGDLDYLPEELRFFIWEGYPSPYVPLHLCAENLVILKMPDSNIRQLGNENQHFPNLETIYLRNSKHLTTLPDLSHFPKIDFWDFSGCVNLVQIHSSTLPNNWVSFSVKNDESKRINIGGSMKGSRSGLVMVVFNYLDLGKLSFHKATIKVLACGDIICGVRFKHVMMPLEEIAELRKGTQSLASLLPFVRMVDWLKGPIEFGHDFNQQYSYNFNCYCSLDFKDYVPFSMYLRRDRGERGVVRRLRRQMINDRSHFFEDGGEREEEEERSSKSTFTRLPDSITRWSLLTNLKLKESDIIGNAGCSIPQVSILKSLIALSHDHHSPRIQPVVDFKLSFPDISPSRVCGRPTFEGIMWSRHEHHWVLFSVSYEINGLLDKKSCGIGLTLGPI